MLQEILVFFIVAGAFAYLARTFLKTANGGAKKCGGCAGACGGKVENRVKNKPQLVQIQINKKP